MRRLQNGSAVPLFQHTLFGPEDSKFRRMPDLLRAVFLTLCQPVELSLFAFRPWQLQRTFRPVPVEHKPVGGVQPHQTLEWIESGALLLKVASRDSGCSPKATLPIQLQKRAINVDWTQADTACTEIHCQQKGSEQGEIDICHSFPLQLLQFSAVSRTFSSILICPISHLFISGCQAPVCQQGCSQRRFVLRPLQQAATTAMHCNTLQLQ